MITIGEVEEIIIRHCDEYLEPLSRLSKDTANDESLVNCSTKFYNYDKIAQKFYEKKGGKKPGDISDIIKTPDMIFFKEDTIFFVEFKNGRIEGIKKKCKERGEAEECQYVKWDIKLKALEGFIVLHKIISECKGQIKFKDAVNFEKTSYILVYNAKKNVNGKEIKSREKKKYRELHGKMFSNRIRFGLGIYKHRFFDDVMTFTENNFKTWLKSNELLDESDPCQKEIFAP